jgi:hypothetical protein
MQIHVVDAGEVEMHKEKVSGCSESLCPSISQGVVEGVDAKP